MGGKTTAHAGIRPERPGSEKLEPQGPDEQSARDVRYGLDLSPDLATVARLMLDGREAASACDRERVCEHERGSPRPELEHVRPPVLYDKPREETTELWRDRPWGTAIGQDLFDGRISRAVEKKSGERNIPASEGRAHAHGSSAHSS
jgi:hypothetical protein